MGKNKQQVPRLRFPGFNDTWEQRKLGEVVERVTRKNTEMISKLPLTISAQYGLIAQTEFFDKQIASKNISGYYLIKNGEFAYNKSYSNGYPWGAVKRLNNYDYGVLSTLYIVFKPTNINSQFLVSYYDTNYWHNQVASIAVEGARNHGLLNISASEFFTTTLAIPKSIQEQTAIGDFFRQLDAAIASHQRKLERVKELKKSLLQKMFPKDGEAFPELRFPNFTDAWEQRKLNEISQKVTEKNVNNIYQETFTNSAEFGIINQRDFFDKDISNKANLAGYYVVQNNDFVYNPRISNFAPVGPIKRNKLGRNGVMSPLYYVFRVDSVDYQFLETYFENTQWHIFMKENGDNGARSDRFAIKDSVFSTMPILLPSQQEQTAIGNFFRQLDAAIASHQRKLEHMQALKKGLLQQMFV